MRKFIIFIFIVLYLTTSFASTMHIIDFFGLSNPNWLAILLGIAFELGAAASLCSLAVLKFTNKTLVWVLFAALTLFQVQANVWHAYAHIQDYKAWVELFWLSNSDLITQKRIISIVSGAVLPLVALGFIKSLVDYIKPGNEDTQTVAQEEELVIPDFIPYNSGPAPVQEPVRKEAEQTAQSSEPEQIDNTESQSSSSISRDDNISRGRAQS